MRGKVLDQMGRGLAALCRVSVGVAAESSSPVPIPIIPELSTIREEDLEQLRRLLHLTSLPFNSTEDEDFKRLIKMLKVSARVKSYSLLVGGVGSEPVLNSLSNCKERM